jgi:hypothetical protein
MKYFLISLIFFMISCGKKEAPASDSKPSAEPAEAEKKIEETPPPPADAPQVVLPTTAEPGNGEMAADDMGGDEDPAATGDGTPVAQPGIKTLNLETQKNLDVPKVTVKPTTRIDKGGGPPPTMSVMGAVDGLIGGTPASDETMRPPKRAPKPDPQATGYHGMDQDEPTQE